MSLSVKAMVQALLVTLLWSSSWVLIKIGLDEIPALTFAGLRYTLAFMCLLPWLLRAKMRRQLAALCWADGLRLALLGLLLYTLTQGAQFLALAYLPAQTTSLFLSFSPVVVAFLSRVLLAERPSAGQWVGVGLYLLGACIFLYPVAFAAGQRIGIIVALVGVLANAGSAVLGRSVNRRGTLSPLLVTILSMGVGALILLTTGVIVQGLPALSPSGWLIVAWLAVINTAFAFTLWNVTLRTLSAMESSVINNTMLIQIALLAWLFLGESLGIKDVTGLLLAALGTLTVQLRGASRLKRVKMRSVRRT